MVGKIKKMIDQIISEKSKQDPKLSHTINAKICMKGVIPKKYDENSPDDPVVIEKLVDIAKELGVRIVV
ncbi:hypothetical protein [uncultured Methanomethylovorans sp.]|uniref:hypothetical protein n=1 Tax=uncultured Methanomethylovorans sp. TaxID=183759 RepID=UPI002AA769A5|nr:hypothetical protein [uncultured Methanomethylovorans sp.]